MESLNHLLHGFAIAATGWNLCYCLIGVTVGMFVGVMPGLGPVAGTAILIPLTFGMEPVSAIIMLSGIYYGAMYGGTITSVLINTPGEGASVITCIDGYEMTKQGRAGTALGVSAIGSFVGGTVAVIGLTFFAPVLAKFALRFGPPEFFCLMLLGMMMLVSLMGQSLVKGMMAALFGFVLAMIGLDPVTAELRFTFGLVNMYSGIELTALAMGLFGISEIMIGAEEKLIRKKPPRLKKLLPESKEWKPTMNAIWRGSGIGFLVGLLPGANAVIASLISYSVEKKVAKDPSRFGKGAIEGVAGPETANNACAGAATIPLFTLGIPSSPTIAVLFGAFMLHGLTPGPMLFQDNSAFVWGVIASFYIGNVILVIMNLPLARLWAKVAMVPFDILFPLVLIFCIVGAYSVNNRLWDVGVMLIFGVIGYFMKKMGFPAAAAVLPFVLGLKMEAAFVQSLYISGGSMKIFLTSPICVGILCFVAVLIGGSIYSSLKNKRGMLSGDIEA
ncbi:tripartite tricarboxylate transporter permease [Candidatus Formimonas warabiya]|uniref:Transporter n=1 Tax=Formimonas warabiya TaxID=1761012 RepID=A0A3G1KZP2_FORW1|nr:tripartite tricarboxylate transporter permease [Candidatus Formimonas warabiya]ATW27877.1 transporter [Candidatus Formimonas warabiya]